MNLPHCLTCFFFLSLQDGNTVNTNILINEGVEGGDVHVLCPLKSPGTAKFFCKEQCEEEDVLIETRAQRAQSGRYSISHDKRFSEETLLVSITQLSKSDAGLYRCGVGAPSSSTSYRNIELIVVDALLDGKHGASKDKPLYTKAGRNVTVRCSFTFSGSRRFFCKERCHEEDVLTETYGATGQRGRYSVEYLGFRTEGRLYVTITQLTASDSGWYWCGLDGSYLGFEIVVTQDSLMLYVGVPLLIAVLPFPLVVLLICRRRHRKPTGLETRGSRDGKNPEITLYENDAQVTTGEDFTYLILHPATRDLNQIYCTLTHTQRARDFVP
ncbi:polymeric immunoglobulin receptor-like isoform X2 [Anabas testudineus]|uniref:polymeric immunoglobulin receptor-like isoform X2 n=1 Tax=Anabas testudineus TaxID=64144 RepID=UPI000E4641A7|nr:polymeric immunoglobulin receptor-like isoform X2 [Anabas testudineus]